MYKHQEQVLEWHKKFGVITNDTPTVVDEKTLKLRCKLLLEEVLEFCIGAGVGVNCTTHNENGDIEIEMWNISSTEPSLVEMADALADIQYVNDGAACTLGIDLEPISNEVHRSNMSKLWKEEDLKDLESDFVVTGNLNEYCVKNNLGKVIKPKSYSLANIKLELEKQKV